MKMDTVPAAPRDAADTIGYAMAKNAPDPAAAGTTEPPANRATATVEAIEQYMLEQQLKPGDPLPTEAALCEQLGVSRSSVREALQQLQALDIVSVRQGRGAAVGEMSLRPLVRTLVLRSSLQGNGLAPLREVVATRKILDLGLAREVVMAFAGRPHPELHAVVDKMVAAAEKGERFLDEDIEFHTGMLRELNNELVEQLTSSMWLVHMAAMPHLPEAGTESMLQTATAHREMLAAAESGDALGYLSAVEHHYAPLEAMLAQLD